MATKPFFSGRIPRDLFNAIEKHIQKTNETKTQVLVNALVEYLELPSPRETEEINKDKINSLENLVNTHQQIIKQLENRISKLELGEKPPINDQKLITSDNTETLTNLPEGTIGPLSESKMSSVAKIGRKTLRNHRNRTYKPREVSINGKPYNLKYQGKMKIDGIGGETSAWIAEPITDN